MGQNQSTAPESSSSALRLDYLDGPIALVTFDQPNSRANTMSQAVLGEWEAIVALLRQRSDLKGMILRSGKPGMFVAGADLRELWSVRPGKTEGARILLERGLRLIAALEALPFPMAAAIDGPCLGGGLELTLGFDYRIGTPNPKTELGCPEVKVGLIPGWGGTQRLPRLIGVAPAAELLSSGESIPAPKAKELGLLDEIVASAALLDKARDMLLSAQPTDRWRAVRQRKQQPLPLSEDQVSAVLTPIRQQIMAKTKGQLPAPLAALDAVANGCRRPLAEGLAAETAAFMPLIGSPISRNLIAVFFMTQRLQKDPGVENAAVQPRAVNTVGVVGAGIMGSGIAGAHVRRGLPVTMLDNQPGAVEKGVAAIGKVVQGRADSGKGSPEDPATVLSCLATSMELKALSDCDVVVEAVVEQEPVKVQLYRDLQPLLKPNAILASNTSTISITRMAAAVAQPERFAGLHFFNPVDRMPLVEVIRGEKTSDETVVTLVALAKRIGKTPIVVRDCPGFLVNRILFPYLNEAMVLLEEGADPRTLDRVATDFGMPMGPITLSDVVGLDTALYAGNVVNTAFADRAKKARILAQLVAAGRLGKKTGAGFYNYAQSSRGTDDPAFLEILNRYRSSRREIGADELTDRLFLPMLTEASRVLLEHIVREPGDVDMGLILGIGFPAFRGGILRWADTLGLRTVVDKLRHYEALGKRFHPTEQMSALAVTGKGFYADA